jgi:hypothetical protein
MLRNVTQGLALGRNISNEKSHEKWNSYVRLIENSDKVIRDNIKMNHKGVEYEGVGSIHLVVDMESWPNLVNMVTNL